jgi:hypothetical protein
MNNIASIGAGLIQPGGAQPSVAAAAVRIAGTVPPAAPGAPAHPAADGSASAFFGKTDGLRDFNAATFGNFRSNVAQIVAFKLQAGMRQAVDFAAVDGANAAKAIASLFS